MPKLAAQLFQGFFPQESFMDYPWESPEILRKHQESLTIFD